MKHLFLDDTLTTIILICTKKDSLYRINKIALMNTQCHILQCLIRRACCSRATRIGHRIVLACQQFSVVFSNVHSKIPFLFCPIRTLWTLKHRFFTPTFNLFVPPQCGLPPVPLSTVTASKLRLATVSWSHNLPRNHPEFSHRAPIVTLGAHFFYRISQQFSQCGIRFWGQYLLQL